MYCEVLLILTLMNIHIITVGTIHQTLNSKLNSVVLSPHANYTDRAAAAGRRS